MECIIDLNAISGVKLIRPSLRPKAARRGPARQGVTLVAKLGPSVVGDHPVGEGHVADVGAPAMSAYRCDPPDSGRISAKLSYVRG